MIKLSKEARNKLTQWIKKYLTEEFEADIGSLDAELLLDILGEKFGYYYYNQGLQDAQTILAKKMYDINEAIGALEK